jgi:hypothetical protein
MLRHVGPECVTLWVETDAPCEVTVTAGDARASRRTFTVHGHHYALVDLEGLAPGTRTPYDVRLDGSVVWPDPASTLPPSLIGVPDPSGPLRIAFGTCRTSRPHDRHYELTHGVDVLRTLGVALAKGQVACPDLLLMLGDQVYADEASPALRAMLRHRPDGQGPPDSEVADFEDYTKLYRLSWADPVVRWLLSTVSTSMIFDDHDVRDDWNTSETWRQEMAATPWWHDRIVGALSSYWIYQHAGNLSAETRADDPFWRAAYGEGEDGSSYDAGGGGSSYGASGDRGAAFDALAARADSQRDSYRWSFERDLGRVRVVIVDSRAGRMLEPGERAMLDAHEWEWFDERATGDVDHLIVGTSLPVLMPKGVHHVQQWDEAVADGAWGPRMARFGEWLRQFFDLEHWAAFRRSFALMEQVVCEVAEGRRGRPPATLSFLSGDVHYSYVARVGAPLEGAATAVHQLTCSPIRNPLQPAMRLLNMASQFGAAAAVGRALSAAVGLPGPSLDWEICGGPWFDNAVALLDLDGRQARATWLSARHPWTAQDPHLVGHDPVELAPPWR